MKKEINSNIFCSAYGHNYFRLNQSNENTPELICKCCKGFFKFETNGDITPVSHKEIKTYASLPFKKKSA